jgi:hypothetical protein
MEHLQRRLRQLGGRGPLVQRPQSAGAAQENVLLDSNHTVPAHLERPRTTGLGRARYARTPALASFIQLGHSYRLHLGV